MRMDTNAQRMRTGQLVLAFRLPPTSFPSAPPPPPHFGVCAPRKTKVVKVTKQSFRRMPIPKLPRLRGAPSVGAEVQSGGAGAAPPFPGLAGRSVVGRGKEGTGAVEAWGGGAGASARFCASAERRPGGGVREWKRMWKP